MKKHFFIESLGPPGSGKTSLATVLKEHELEIQVELPPYFREVQHIPFFIFNTIKIAPTLGYFLLKRKEGVGISNRDMALMSILNGWGDALEKNQNYPKVIFLEEGAVCLMAKLLGNKSSILLSTVAYRWWMQTYKKWAEFLDLIVVFDTPTHILLERIRQRTNQYEFETMSDVEALDYLDLIKQSQEQALHALEAIGNLKIVRYKTTEIDSASIAFSVLQILKRQELG